MIFGAKIEYEGPDGNTLVLDTGDMNWVMPISDEALGELDAALNPYRLSMIEKETVRREFEAAGRVSWDEYRHAQERTDPEWAEGLAELGDNLRKAVRERGDEGRDYGDEDKAA